MKHLENIFRAFLLASAALIIATVNRNVSDSTVLLNLPYSKLLACLHDQNKSGFFGGPAFI